MLQKKQEVDEETSYKEAFKVLSPKLIHVLYFWLIDTDLFILINFCRSVPPEILGSFLLVQVFSKDREGCIPPEELKFVLANLPNNVALRKPCSPLKRVEMLQVCPDEIEDMIAIVDKNGDGDSLSLTFLFSMRKGRVKKPGNSRSGY